MPSTQTTENCGETTGTRSLCHATLTPKQQQDWGDTMSMMVFACPGFQRMWYNLLNSQNNAGGEYVAVMSREVDVAATDGQNVIINPDSFFLMTTSECVYVGAHEIVHNVYGDVEFLQRCHQKGTVPMNDGTTRPFVNSLMQKSMDARINAMLDESKIGTAPKVSKVLKEWLDKAHPGHERKVGDPFGHFDPDVKSSDSVIDIYKRYYDEQDPTGKGGEGEEDNPGGFDTLMKPGQATGKDPHQAAQERDQGQWEVQIAVAQKLEEQRNPGKVAAALKRLFQSILEPEVPWIDVVETLVKRTCNGDGYDWSQPDPWLGNTDGPDMYFAPAEVGFGAGWIVQWGDTSGSRSDQEIASQIGETSGIMESLNPRRLTVVWCDAEVGGVQEIEDFADLQNLKPVGGGGTDYQPVLDWIAAQDEVPDLFIGFTDGAVNHPKQTLPFPVIWASSTDAKYPFGQVVRVNKRAKA